MTSYSQLQGRDGGPVRSVHGAPRRGCSMTGH